MRADAARNRARVLEVAYETFASDGLGVPIDEIARRAGVGAGTVYRHFPAKEDLYRAVVAERIRTIVDEARSLLGSGDPGAGLFDFLRSMVLQWGAADRGLVDALAGVGIDINCVVPESEGEFLAILGELLAAAQRAGSVRADVTVPEVKALLVGCQAIQAYNPAVAEHATDVVLDGLRAQ
ncbi:helix-turn-helix transcriptional regulator [Mycolicibacterium fluoranthenivorans]|uniref:Helix-turn-helix transcriptional regulator n=1 Tax=Mycolicibacterium fluoranthenivorans TaxID=258505 RepID=A0A1G4WIJ8_9MYCO|nr:MULTISPECIES: TetR/AcrR family transcriptional regulator [Mycobacteriaceae]MCV7252593.1 helix-turn-helix transcriptional regulator [Mycobacterium hackensackense]QNJ94329.1 helix-turn-helix transcriptional regulator [Mycolicibacterium fluoranthenivorans]SCX22945.1 transcriptional regulator, TetR family [Mycolicibacterium fluoranthenivorans]